MILVTGVTGYIGRVIAKELLDNGESVIAAVRQMPNSFKLVHNNLRCIEIGNISSQTNWESALLGVHTVVHCAARAHMFSEQTDKELAAYREVNVDGTLNLARQASAANVRRFVFLSSVGVNGRNSVEPFKESDTPDPHDVYTISKFEAEQALIALEAQTDIEVVVIRPPLVYGPGAPGNFAKLLSFVMSGIPLPLGSVKNRRSLVALDNLVNMVLLCSDRTRSPQAANQIFMIADDQDVSTTTLLRKLAKAVGRPSRLLPVPIWLLRTGAVLLGKRSMSDSLLGNLQVDTTKARSLLGWYPVVTMDQQLAAIFTLTAIPSHQVSKFGFCMLRVFDVLLAGTGVLFLSPLLLFVYVVLWFDTHSPLFKQVRVGQHQRPFVLIKFRTMRLGTASVASHLVNVESITRVGSLLRRTKIDELPQLLNVLLGDMSLVGPRPSLFSQDELIKARSAQGVYAVRPGITGLAQVNGIDMSTPELLAHTDAKMLKELNFSSYLKFIFMTILGKGSGDKVKR
jgi:nucleoside-diphosphate-sugar epimerase/lipopolysaccharide/colanic/teichoic acid biosynthesis glycosyltransferase